MLTQIELRHFKCFELLKLPLAPLTLLAGANASGKSTVLQAIGLLHQSVNVSPWESRLLLNGPVLRLGRAADVIDQVHGRRSCSITILDSFVKRPAGRPDLRIVREKSRAGRSGSAPTLEELARDIEARRAARGTASYSWDFEGEPADRSLRLACLRYEDEVTSRSVGPDGEGPVLLSLEEDPGFRDRLERLHYLTAERLGPRDSYRLRDSEEDFAIGPAGENAAALLEAGGSDKVLPGLVLGDAPPTRFRQIEARMASFFPGCVLDVQQLPAAGVVMLGIRTSDDTEFHRPVHTGFGLTQVLPIVIAALSAGHDALLLIENPEVHLHPSGQARMGHFLAEVAAAGVQVLVESHSDHVLNGIRRAVKAGILAPDRAALHFFSPRSEDAPQVQTPTMDAEGGLDFWPGGFFDQFDKDLSALAGWD